MKFKHLYFKLYQFLIKSIGILFIIGKFISFMDFIHKIKYTINKYFHFLNFNIIPLIQLILLNIIPHYNYKFIIIIIFEIRLNNIVINFQDDLVFPNLFN